MSDDSDDSRSVAKLILSQISVDERDVIKITIIIVAFPSNILCFHLVVNSKVYYYYGYFYFFN